MELQQVHGNAMEVGTWVLATYEDTPPRVVYMCNCGKVNAIDRGRLDPDGVVIDAAGLPESVVCERKGCAEEHSLKFVDGTAESMNEHRDALDLRRASAAALATGVTAESLAAAEAAKVAAAELAAAESPTT